MSCVRRGMLLLVLGPALLASGCIEYVIEAPGSDVVLLRGGGERIAQMARNREQPILQQRQFGLFNGLIFLHKDKFRKTLAGPSGEGQDLENVGIVTGAHGLDVLLEVATSLMARIPLVTSRTVRVFIDDAQ